MLNRVRGALVHLVIRGNMKLSGSEEPVPEISTTPPTPTQHDSTPPSEPDVPEIEEERRTPQPEAEARSHENLQASLEEIWYLKEISFRPVPEAAPRLYKILTQNFNGSVLNALVLSITTRTQLNYIQSARAHSSLFVRPCRNRITAATVR